MWVQHRHAFLKRGVGGLGKLLLSESNLFGGFSCLLSSLFHFQLPDKLNYNLLESNRAIIIDILYSYISTSHEIIL